MNIIFKICKKRIYRKLNLVSKLLVVFWKKKILFDENFKFQCSGTKISGKR